MEAYGVYTDMKQWNDIRQRVLVKGVSKREILRETGMHWTTLEKILSGEITDGDKVKIDADQHTFRFEREAVQK